MKPTILCLLLAFTTLSLQAEDQFSVSEFTFTKPSGWKKLETNSPMRAAQLLVPSADSEPAEVVFYYFGRGQGGGVRANLDRWIGQFEEPREKLQVEEESSEINGIKVTYLSAQGTFLSGAPFGPKTPKKDQALFAAIVEGKQGSVFIKTTGPIKIVHGSREATKKMVKQALE